MKYKSVFDVIGPVMIGPSSSHTAGAARIGKMARGLFTREPKWVNVHLYGSFAKTHQGHGTDQAIVGGILDFETDNPDMVHSLEIALERGIEIRFIEEEAEMSHPNTARIVMGDSNGQIELLGISIGGGKVEIVELDGFGLRLSGNAPSILVLHQDRPGAIAAVSQVLACKGINIGHMDVSRKEVGQESLMTIEVDQNVRQAVLDEISHLEHIIRVARIVI